ncbi:MAG: type II secretion system protein [Gammaproteobacteria bacterium]
MTRRAAQRGFSLVEIGIVLAIVGILLGGVLIPSYTSFSDDIYAREERRMEEIKTAVLGYAIRHQTSGRLFAAVSQSAANRRVFSLPGGRPYLPCPDITGDGYEDRTAFDRSGFIFFTPGATLTVDPGVSRNDVIQYGSCFATRGVLPWRTLGVSPADSWGNLYTYQVDAVFADAVVGFNQNSVLDKYDARAVVTVSASGENLHREREPFSALLTGIAGFDDLATEDSIATPVVCGAGACNATATLSLAAGKQAAGEFQLLLRNFAPPDIVAGIPFAVVSHGKNGAGAVNYLRNAADKASLDPVSPGGLICNAPVDGSRLRLTVLLETAEAHNFPQPELPNEDSKCRPAMVNFIPAQNGFLYSQPRGRNFDDIVSWMTREELFDEMRRIGALDAPDFPVLRAY